MGYRRRSGPRERRATDRQDWATVCPTHGKRSYGNRADARRAARIVGTKGAREYPCTAIEGGWHWGILPPAVRWGRKTAAEVYPEVHRRHDEGTAA